MNLGNINQQIGEHRRFLREFQANPDAFKSEDVAPQLPDNPLPPFNPMDQLQPLFVMMLMQMLFQMIRGGQLGQVQPQPYYQPINYNPVLANPMFDTGFDPAMLTQMPVDMSEFGNFGFDFQSLFASSFGFNMMDGFDWSQMQLPFDQPMTNPDIEAMAGDTAQVGTTGTHANRVLDLPVQTNTNPAITRLDGHLSLLSDDEFDALFIAILDERQSGDYSESELAKSLMYYMHRGTQEEAITSLRLVSALVGQDQLVLPPFLDESYLGQLDDERRGLVEDSLKLIQ